MLSLIIDTTDELVTGLFNSDTQKVVAFTHLESNRAHVEKMAQIVQEMLHKNGFTAESVTEIIVSKGPGQYTGLRAGLAFAKIFAQTRKIPIVAVCTLQVIARQLQKSENSNNPLPKYILAATDAKRREIYYAIFSADSENLTEILPANVAKSSEVLEKVREIVNQEEIALVGKIPDEDSNLLGLLNFSIKLPGVLTNPDCLSAYYEIAHFSEKFILYNEISSDILSPIYLRSPDIS